MPQYVVGVGKFVGYKGINYHAGCVVEMSEAEAQDLESAGTISVIYDTTKRVESPIQEEVECLSTEEK